MLQTRLHLLLFKAQNVTLELHVQVFENKNLVRRQSFIRFFKLVFFLNILQK